MKPSLGSAFPFAVLVVLAGLSFWLDQASEITLIPNDGKTRHDPDTLVERLTVHRHGPDGALKYKLTAERMEHYPDDESSLVFAPRLTSYRPDSPEIVLTGRQAIVTQEGKHVLVQGDVVVTRAAFAERAELVARTPELTVLPDAGKAYNQHPVHITQGESWMRGVGVQVDNNLGTFSLQSQVTGEYHAKPVPSRETAP
ncbi:MAG: LPS export ABC transporter periplasmic protein LptC [Azovibrio sp.]|nr:LPS export ABC transporter periplasmic protein LptC [Azovibrio sp.]